MIRLRFLVAAAMTLVIAISHAAPLPTQAIYATQAVGEVKLSPDGAKLAFQKKENNRVELWIYDFATNTTVPASKVAKAADDPNRFDQAFWYTWLAPQRLVVASDLGKVLPFVPIWDRSLANEPRPFPYGNNMTPGPRNYRLSILDAQTGAWVDLKGQAYERNLARDGEYLWHMTTAVSANGSSNIDYIVRSAYQYVQVETKNKPNVFALDLTTGKAEPAGKYPSMEGDWFLQPDGTPRVVTQTRRSGVAIYQLGAKGKWEQWAVLDASDYIPTVHGLGEGGKTLIVTRRGEDGREELVEYDLDTRSWRAPLVKDVRYSIDDGEFPLYAEIKLAGPLFSPMSRRLLGVRYFTDSYRQRWFEPKLAAIQQTLDKALPGTSNAIVEVSENCDRALVFSWSTRDPGFYFVMDFSARKMDGRILMIPGIEPREMGATTVEKIRSRDGIELDAYVTRPPGKNDKPQPLVVFLGDTLRQRALPFFNPILQMMATRGMVVLQVNHRGVPGYGRDFETQGRDPSGETLHHDIEDAVRWAVNAGVADPGRIAVMGEHFGGFSALYALEHSQGLYRCGVAISPISDWLDVLPFTYDVIGENKNRLVGDSPEAYTVPFRDDYIKFGVSDKAARARSPLYFADQIKAPLLLVSRLDDDVVSPRSANEAFTAALKRAEVPFDVIQYNSVSQDKDGSKRTLDEAGKAADGIINFLVKHLDLEPNAAAK